MRSRCGLARARQVPFRSAKPGVGCARFRGGSLPSATVVVPCFNEERRLAAARFRPLVAHPDVRVLFVDDGSTDGTLSMLQDACAQLGPNASVLRLAQNCGKAEAVRRGLLA